MGEGRHPGWVLAHPDRTTSGVRVATFFMLPKDAHDPIYPKRGGGGIERIYSFQERLASSLVSPIDKRR